MIEGIGIDIVSVERMRLLCNRHGERIVDDLFSAREIGTLQLSRTSRVIDNKTAQRLAVIFAAKEAAVKAIGLPVDIPFLWCEIEIFGNDRINVIVTDQIEECARKSGIVSLTGCTTYSLTHCMAIVIGESD